MACLGHFLMVGPGHPTVPLWTPGSIHEGPKGRLDKSWESPCVSWEGASKGGYLPPPGRQVKALGRCTCAAQETSYRMSIVKTTARPEVRPTGSSK